MNKLEQELLAAGWCRSPNNIHALPRNEAGLSPIFYAGAHGMPEQEAGTEVQVLPDRIRVFRNVFFGAPYSKKSCWDQVRIHVFDNVPEFLAYCESTGQRAKSLPPYSQGGFD